MLDNQATSAKTLTLAAIIVQSALFLFGVSVLLYAQITIKSLPAVFEYTLVGFAIEVVALFVWALLDYLLVFRKIVQGRAGGVIHKGSIPTSLPYRRPVLSIPPFVGGERDMM